ncbi:MAG: rhomboid-like protein, partial [Mycobacterium sp.]
VTGHIGATLLVAVGLTAAIEFGWLPLSISRASDVGVSYGALAVLGALTAAIPSGWRAVWIGWWVPVALAAAALGDDFTDVGHSVALFLGMLVSLRLGGPARWTRVRYALLAVSAVFGFLMLAHGAWSMLGAASVGVMGAVAAQLIARSRTTRRQLALAALPPEPVLNG